MKNFFTKVLPAIAFVMSLPLLAYAQTTSQCTSLNTGLGKVICQIHELLNSIVPVLLVLGVVYFIWGVLSYVIGTEEEDKKKGREKMIYGIIGLAVIVGMWGLVEIVVNTFGLTATAPALTAVAGDSGSCSLVTNPKLGNLLGFVTCMIERSVIPLLFALAVAAFIWGVVQFVIHSDEEAKKENGRQFMLWGIIALTVMIGVWSLVNILGGTFGLNTSAIPQVRP